MGDGISVLVVSCSTCTVSYFHVPMNICIWHYGLNRLFGSNVTGTRVLPVILHDATNMCGKSDRAQGHTLHLYLHVHLHAHK